MVVKRKDWEVGIELTEEEEREADERLKRAREAAAQVDDLFNGTAPQRPIKHRQYGGERGEEGE